MQRLYENHKILTYPRTDSRYLSSDVIGTLKERLKACAVGPYKKMAGSLSMKPVKANKSFVDDKKSKRPSCNYSNRTVCTVRTSDK